MQQKKTILHVDYSELRKREDQEDKEYRPYYGDDLQHSPHPRDSPPAPPHIWLLAYSSFCSTWTQGSGGHRVHWEIRYMSTIPSWVDLIPVYSNYMGTSDTCVRQVHGKKGQMSTPTTGSLLHQVYGYINISIQQLHTKISSFTEAHSHLTWSLLRIHRFQSCLGTGRSGSTS